MAELEGGVELGVAEEDEVVVFGEVFEEEAEFVKGFLGEEVGVIDDGEDGFAFGVEVACFGDEAGFAFVVVTDDVNLHGLAEEAQEAGPGVEGAVDDGGDPLFGVVMDDGVFEDGFAGAGLAEDDAEAALLGVDVDDFKEALLVGKEGLGFVNEEGVLGNAEVGADHGGVVFACVVVGEVLGCRFFVRTGCGGSGRWR